MIYFYYGDEEFNISSKIEQLKKQLDPNYIEMSYKTYEAPAFADLISIITTQPMMFGKMLIVIDCFKYLSGKSSDGQGSFDDKQLTKLAESLDCVNENIDLVFVAIIPPDSDKKIDKRRKIFKILSKYESQEFLKIPSYKTSELEEWIKAQGKSKKLKISNEVAAQLLLQIGADLRQLDNEIEKLKIFSNNSIPTVQMVKDICTTNEDLFVFIDFLVNGDLKRAIIEYKKLITKKHPLEIMAVLHTMIGNKIKLKAYSAQHSSDEIAKILNMNPYRAKLEIQALKNVSLKRLVSIKENLTNAEFRIKSGQSNLEPEMEIEYAILQ